MKKQDGFTLIELIVVICIVALLLAMGIPAYSTWQQRHDVENEMAQLYSDLQFARSTAYTKKEVAGISWSSGAAFSQYQIETNATSGCTTIATEGSTTVETLPTMRYPITPSPTTTGNLSFNGRGLVSSPSTVPMNFYINPSYGSPTNCVSVSLTKISLGTWEGSACEPE